MKLLLVLMTVLSVQVAYGYGIGYSAHPLRSKKHMLSTELIGITSTGGGIGMQERYTRKFVPYFSMDAGMGINDGDRSHRFFIGADYELYPDYMRQPRVSIKVSFERAKEYDLNRNVLTFSPIMSKGFSFWGREGHPFLAFPISLSLEGTRKSYQTQMAVAAGITGKLPFTDLKHLSGNIETQVGLTRSFTAVFVGISYPLN